MLFFYIVLIAGLIYQQWPAGNATLWQKIGNGYWAYFLLAPPIVIFFWLFNRMARKELKRISDLKRDLRKPRRR